MKRGTKRITVWTATIVFILAVAFGWLYHVVRSDLSGMCANKVLARVNAPDGRHKALVFRRDCGATTGFSTQVSVLGISEKLSNEAGNAFIAGRRPKEPRIEVHWIDASDLVIRNANRLHAFRKETRIRSITIHYE